MMRPFAGPCTLARSSIATLSPVGIMLEQITCGIWQRHIAGSDR